MKTLLPPQPSAAEKLRFAAFNVGANLIRQWAQTFQLLWGPEIPPLPDNAPAERLAERADRVQASRERSAAILADLGPEASELLDESKALLEFIVPRLPAVASPETRGIITQQDVQKLLAWKPATTTHPDGTVTLDPAE